MKRLIAASLALATVASGLAMSVDSASAREGRRGAFAAGAAAGVVGGALLGGALAQPRERPYYGYEQQDYAPQRRCHFERRRVQDEYGYWRAQRVRVCYRPGY